jgi:hypothetical protein
MVEEIIVVSANIIAGLVIIFIVFCTLVGEYQAGTWALLALMVNYASAAAALSAWGAYKTAANQN